MANIALYPCPTKRVWSDLPGRTLVSAVLIREYGEIHPVHLEASMRHIQIVFIVLAIFVVALLALKPTMTVTRNIGITEGAREELIQVLGK